MANELAYPAIPDRMDVARTVGATGALAGECPGDDECAACSRGHRPQHAQKPKDGCPTARVGSKP
jgi:hypothetical protein